MPAGTQAWRTVSQSSGRRRTALPRGTMPRPSTGSGWHTARLRRSGPPIRSFRHCVRPGKLRLTRLRRRFIEFRAGRPAMTASSDDTSSTSRSDRRKPARVRNRHYMIAPVAPGLTRQTLIDRLKPAADVEVVQTHAVERGSISPPIAVVRMTDESAAALRRSTGGALVIEPDRYLRAASFAGSSRAAAAMTPLSPGFAVTIQALSESGQPMEHAEVQIAGEQGVARGLTGKDGKVDFTLYGELPETITELLVKARSGYRALWRRWPNLQVDAVNKFNLEPLSLPKAPDWGAKAMRFDQLPSEYRGKEIKIALIDSGVATSHKQLAEIAHGIDIRGDADGRSWSQDVLGHGTQCAGIIAAIPDAASGVRGYAPEAELHVCRLPPDARCSDLLAALDYCVQSGIDVAFLGFGCERGSAIVEQRIEAAKRNGVAMIAAAGNSAGAVLFPAFSPHVLAVRAIGQVGSDPEHIQLANQSHPQSSLS